MVMVFSLAACNRNNELSKYKAEKMTELQAYADEKGENNYSEYDWAAICKAVTDGKAAIEAAENKPAVTTAFIDAKVVIDAVEREELSMGKFYTLQEAYDEGLLTVDDLQSIANHFNNGTLPADTLSSAIEAVIKETAAENMRNDDLSPIAGAKANDFLILKYFGTYNGSVAVIINDPYHDYPAVELDINETIAGVLFHYTNPNRIVVWKAN